jgi:hypothetical protein
MLQSTRVAGQRLYSSSPDRVAEVHAGLDEEDLVPKEIKSIVEGCLRHSTIDRPNIRSVITDLDRLSTKFLYEKKGYTPQRALEDEPEELLK